MKVCILSDAYEDSDSPLKDVDDPCDPAPYLEGHECHHVTLRKATAVRDLIQLSRQGYDVFFNLCDGAWDEDRPGIEVVQALERLGCAYTGATPEFWEPSREAMKRACRAWGIGTPAGVMVRDGEGIERAADTLRFPLIVKHPSSYSSIGLTPASRVATRAELEEQAWRMIEAYGATLVEEFIEGREVSVLVAEDPDRPDEPTAYQPVEIRFPPGESFKHFDLKWVDFGGMSTVPLADPELAARVKDAAAKLFLGVRGAGYGRCDVRVDERGEPFFLEINPNPGVFYPDHSAGTADLILHHDPAGHRGFAEQVVRAAVARRDRRRKCWEVRADREGSYGMYALRPVAAGEVIEPYEEGPHHLVSRRHVEARWGAPQREWFERYAWPMSDDVWAIWSPDPEEWKPINHSCDPSAWLEGLDIVARRDLAPGEEVTLDYATFCTEPMEEFACACGAAGCRGVVRGTDYLEPFVERYGRHVSDHVARKRREAAAATGRVGEEPRLESVDAEGRRVRRGSRVRRG